MPRYKRRFRGSRSPYIHDPPNGKIAKRTPYCTPSIPLATNALTECVKTVRKHVEETPDATPYDLGMRKPNATCTHFQTNLCEVEVQQEHNDRVECYITKNETTGQVTTALKNMTCISMCTTNQLTRRAGKAWLIGEALHGRFDAANNISENMVEDKRMLLKVIFPPQAALNLIIDSVNILVRRMKECGVPCDEYVCVGWSKDRKTNSCIMLTSWNALDTLRMVGLSLHFTPGLRIQSRYRGVRKHKKICLASMLLRMYGTVSMGWLKELSTHGDCDIEHGRGVWCETKAVCRTTKRSSVIQSIPEDKMVKMLSSRDYDPIRLYNFVAIVNSWCALICSDCPHMSTTYPSDAHFRHYSRLHILLNLLMERRRTLKDKKWSESQRTEMLRWKYHIDRRREEFENNEQETIVRGLEREKEPDFSYTIRNLLGDSMEEKKRKLEEEEIHKVKSDQEFREDFIKNICCLVYAFLNPEYIPTIKVKALKILISLFHKLMYSIYTDDKEFTFYVRKKYVRLFKVFAHINPMIENESSLGEVCIARLLHNINLMSEKEDLDQVCLYKHIDFMHDLFGFLFEPYIRSRYDIYELVRLILMGIQSSYVTKKETEEAKDSYFKYQSKSVKYEIYSNQYASVINRTVQYAEDKCLSRLRDVNGMREPVSDLYHFLKILDRCVMEDCRNVKTSIYLRNGSTHMCYEMEKEMTQDNEATPMSENSCSSQQHTFHSNMVVKQKDVCIPVSKVSSTDLLEESDLTFPVCGTNICMYTPSLSYRSVLSYDKCFFLIKQ